MFLALYLLEESDMWEVSLFPTLSNANGLCFLDSRHITFASH